MSFYNKDCTPVQKINRVYHTFVVWSNIFYLSASYAAFHKGYYLFSLLMLGMVILSVIYHSDTKHDLLRDLDMYYSSFVVLLFTIYIYTYRRYRLTLASVIASIVGGISIILFLVGHYLESEKGVKDLHVGIFGPILASVKVEEDKCRKDIDVNMYLFYHILWHTISGLSLTFFIISLKQDMVVPN